MEQEGKWLNHNSADLRAENYKTAVGWGTEIGNSKMTITMRAGGVMKRVLSLDNPDRDPLCVQKNQDEVLVLIVLSSYAQSSNVSD